MATVLTFGRIALTLFQFRTYICLKLYLLDKINICLQALRNEKENLWNETVIFNISSHQNKGILQKLLKLEN